MSSMPVLLLYAQAGTIPFIDRPGLCRSPASPWSLFVALSEPGFNDRFKDHYLVAPQSTVCMLIALAFT